MRWLHALRARARLLARRSAESRMAEEFDFHLDMEAERLARAEGLSSDEARRRALVAFGGVERHKEALRDGHALAWLGGMSLDLTLGLRMMAKYPGLTLVGAVGMAVAVAIGTIAFGLVSRMADPAVPLDEGARIVSIQNLDTRRASLGRRTHLHDLAVWREALTAVGELGAYRLVGRNLVTRDGRAESVRVAEMTASGFRIARVAPLIGRYLTDEDERPGAPPVVVIGHSVWRSRFGGASDVVGQVLRFGDAPYTVVGVMPAGFAFPVNNRVWVPLRLDPSAYPLGDAPEVQLFGRLTPGASLGDARRQLETIGARLAAARPATHAHVRPRIVPYARAFTDSPETAWVFWLAQAGVSMLLVVIGTNVAILVYARTASRAGEIAVRSALGASRGRIVAQLFAEALVLSLGAAAAGLALGRLALGRVNAYVDRTGAEQLPFWMHFGVSGSMVAYVLALAVLGAVIVGALPALWATRGAPHAALQLRSGGVAMRLGKGWTAMIVAQVALAVAALPLALAGLALVVRQALAAPSVPPDEWLTADVVLDRHTEPRPIVVPRGTDVDASAAAVAGEPRDLAFEARAAALQEELVRRLRAERGVVSVVRSSDVLGAEPSVPMEAEGAPPHDVLVGEVDPEFFAAYGVPVLAGRALRRDDAATTPAGERLTRPVVVNRTFVAAVLGGGNPLGRRVRVVLPPRLDGAPPASPAAAPPWHEVVGVVPDFPSPVNPRFPEARMYEALVPGATGAAVVSVRVKGGAPAEFGARLRALALAVDPMLRVREMEPLDDALRDQRLELRVMVSVVCAVTLAVLLLSAAGIYALMSFTVTRRRREIGIRTALGAGPRGIIWGVLSRAMGQVALGIAVGCAVAWALDDAIRGGFTGGRGASLLAAVAALMAAVGALAALGPARRALRVQPTEALKGE